MKKLFVFSLYMSCCCGMENPLLVKRPLPKKRKSDFMKAVETKSANGAYAFFSKDGFQISAHDAFQLTRRTSLSLKERKVNQHFWQFDGESLLLYIPLQSETCAVASDQALSQEAEDRLQINVIQSAYEMGSLEQIKKDWDMVLAGQSLLASSKTLGKLLKPVVSALRKNNEYCLAVGRHLINTLAAKQEANRRRWVEYFHKRDRIGSIIALTDEWLERHKKEPRVYRKAAIATHNRLKTLLLSSDCMEMIKEGEIAILSSRLNTKLFSTTPGAIYIYHVVP